MDAHIKKRKSGKSVRPESRARPTLNTRRVAGRDLMAAISVKANTPAGTTLLELSVNPLTLNAPRLKQEAELWHRWRPLKVRFEVVSSASSLVVGSYSMAWTSDSQDSFPSGSNSLARLAALKNKWVRIDKRASFNAPTSTTQRWLYVSSREPDDSLHGKFVLALSSDLGALTASSAITLNVFVDWAFEFSGPSLPGVAVQQAIYADSDYAGYHTTSTSDWAAGKKLSLKQHAGGSLVPFPAAVPQTIYKLDTSAVLTYKKPDGSKGNVKYGVLIPNFAVKAFALFEDLKKAQSFVTSGDSTHVLDYYDAGDVVSPDNPAWYEAVSLSQIIDPLQAENSVLKSRVEELEQRLAALEMRGTESQYSFLEEEGSRDHLETMPST